MNPDNRVMVSCCSIVTWFALRHGHFQVITSCVSARACPQVWTSCSNITIAYVGRCCLDQS